MLPRRTKSRRVPNWIFLAVGCGLAFGIGAGAFLALTNDLPQIRALESFTPDAVTEILDSDGRPLAESFREKRRPVALSAMPTHLTDAIIATEDRHFYDHGGVDLRGILRAVYRNLIAGGYAEGASTITQQLAKTLFLTPRKTLSRKLKEAILAIQLERRYTKDEILGFYLNQIYLGSGAYGVESAARRFFGKSVPDLTLSEAALIAAMPRAPSRYSPLVNPALALKRRNIVLKLMARDGRITQDQATAASAEPVTTEADASAGRHAAYFVDFALATIDAPEITRRLPTAGLRVHTTLNRQLQTAAEAAVAKHLPILEERLTRNEASPSDLQAALVALDVHSGAILAMVGGIDFSVSPYNRAAVAKRQPGSAFKPIVFAAAIERGFSQRDLILDAPVAFPGSGGTTWQPRNYSGTFAGEITLRKALTASQNIPAVRLIDRLGPEAVAAMAGRMGIQSPLDMSLALALGTSPMTLLELTAAYAVFPAGGRYVRPVAIQRIDTPDGQVLWEGKPKRAVVLDRVTAAIVTDMLVGVVQEGTGRRARRLPRTVGGKTGTTNNAIDALFIGFSPDMAVGVWVGRDNGAPLGPKETGARAALPIWIDFMEAALKDAPHRYFDIPDGVVKANIHPITGDHQHDATPGTVLMVLRPKNSLP